MKPEPFSEISLATVEHAAITEGSSTAIGTINYFPFILKPSPRPNGSGITPMQFSII